jgi:hypothetical protein
MATNPWNASKHRVAIHEVGHVLIEYLLTQETAGATIYEDAGIWRGESHGRDEKATQLASPAQWQDGAAIFFGGWAAVHLAINRGHLNREPVTVEVTPGDHGFLGPIPADEGIVAWAASHANPGNPNAVIAQAKADALKMIDDNLAAVLDLADILDGGGYLAQHHLESVLNP